MSTATVPQVQSFAHEALLYEGDEGFVEGVVPFVREGVAAGEPVLVAVGARKIELLRDALNGDGERVLFADMAEIGANPARIIPVWQEFVGRHLSPGHPVRGVGEPISPERGADELVECQRHEALLNLAFAGSAWQLLCPYDTRSLDGAVVEEALRSHPLVAEHGVCRPSELYRGPDAIDPPLPDPPADARELRFDVDSLAACRCIVYWRGAGAGLGIARTNDLVLAVNEILSNSLRHGGGSGLLRIWQDDATLVCEVRDRGRIRDPLADRRRPGPEQTGGRGLWMANQLCDLVQIRSGVHGTAVRLSMRRR